MDQPVESVHGDDPEMSYVRKAQADYAWNASSGAADRISRRGKLAEKCRSARYVCDLSTSSQEEPTQENRL